VKVPIHLVQSLDGVARELLIRCSPPSVPSFSHITLHPQVIMLWTSRCLLSRVSIGKSASRKRSIFSLAEAYSRDCSWKPCLLHHSDIERILPWGFIDQSNIFELVMPSLARQLSSKANKREEAEKTKLRTASTNTTLSDPATRSDRIDSLKSWMQDETCNSRAGGECFLLAGTCHAEFTEGARLAYKHIADLWSSGSPLELDHMQSVAAPGLAELMCQVHSTCREKHGVQPRLVLSPNQPILASVIKVEMEEGRAHKPGQLFDRWDRDDFWAQLLLGAAGPEAQLMHSIESKQQSVLTGSDPHAHLPHRLVAHMLFLVEEKYEYKHVAGSPAESNSAALRGCSSFDEHSIINNDFQMQCHVWEFETDIGVSFNSGEHIKLQWRVRNINNALKPRTGHVLKSDGLVERRLGRWVY